LNRLREQGLKIWAEENAACNKLIIECFPAEAIWAAKRLGYYSESLSASCVKAYKNKGGVRLSEALVRKCVNEGNRYRVYISGRLAAAAVQRMLIYGSKAWGQGHADSDLDVLLIVKNEAGPLKRGRRQIWAESFLPRVRT
jgi:hypothetical protein